MFMFTPSPDPFRHRLPTVVPLQLLRIDLLSRLLLFLARF